jgi:hypothetical protein
VNLPVRLTLIAVFLSLVAAAQFMTAVPASAITVELANKCRAMSIKAYPPQRAGSKTGNAGEARRYYAACIAGNGAPPQDKPAGPRAAPAR